MSDSSATLIELAGHYGIATDFWDWKGRYVTISAETIVHVLGALGVDASTDELQQQALEEVHLASWRRVVAPCVVVVQGNTATMDVHVPAGEPLQVELRLESGDAGPVQQVDNFNPDRMIDGAMRGEATFSFGQELPLGYHDVVVTSSEGRHTSRLVITPPHVGVPRAMEGQRVWGYATQLYSVTSARSWGVGDLGDLADLVTWAGAEQGADYVLINPLHAAEPVPPMEPSPYLPASRRFLNPLYIRPDAIPEYHELAGSVRKTIKQAHRRIVELSDPQRINRDASWIAKRDVLERIFESRLRPIRQTAFDAYVRREGEALQRFAIWSVLCETFGTNWRQWPEEYRDADSPAVRVFADTNAERVRFHRWLQWVADEQLSGAQGAALRSDMSVGVVTDLAVGVSQDGAETWMMPDVFAHDVVVGAPPDQYNQFGQDWGQPPWRPDRLAELAYEPFRAMVRAAIRRVGGVRIDHIMGLFRLWWVPKGGSPKEGTYVRYNHEAMVGILALEAYRSQALVVGEDLGTVEPWVREYLATRGILGTSVAWFEYSADGTPLDPAHWREYCMASVTTHDLPPTLGYLGKDHVQLRHELGLLTEPLEEEMSQAQREQDQFISILRDKGLLAPGETDALEVLVALHAYIRSSPSHVLQVALADAVGERRIQNQPGTIDEYPNWRVPLADADGTPLTIEDIMSAELPRRIATVMNQPG